MSFYLFLFILAAGFSGFLAVYAFVLDRKSAANRLFSLGMILFALEMVIAPLASFSTPEFEREYYTRLLLVPRGILPGVWLAFSFVFGRENYAENLRTWKWVVLLSFLLPLGIILTSNSHLLETSISHPSLFTLTRGGYFFHITALATALLILMNLEKTFRAAVGRKRWQVKFMIIGLASLWGFRIYELSQIILFKTLDLGSQPINGIVLLVGNALLLKSLSRLRDQSPGIYVSTSFLFNSITFLVIGIYFLIIGVLAQFAESLGILAQLPIQAFIIFVGLIGLVILLLSDRIRMKGRIFISRHLKRPTHDYRKIWEGFSEQTVQVVEEKQLCQKVAENISRNVEALSVSVWLVAEGKKDIYLAGSTAFSSGDSEDTGAIKAELGKIIAKMKDDPPLLGLDILEGGDRSEERKKEHLLKEKSRIRYHFPLISRGEFLGVVTVGDRVGWGDLSAEDRELIKTVADQTAGSLLTLRLLDRLAGLREMKAFQTFSAFMMHDLKNLASRLSLTVQNLPVYFDNPEFRKDALSIIQSSVDKINAMCKTLTTIRQRLELQLVESDVNDLVGKVVANLDGLLKTSLQTNLQPVKKIFIDPEQVKSVLTNLILNANDAIPERGVIQIATGRTNGWIFLTVADNGCGMSEEFIEKSLFRPFKTTKKNGMGIGLFQSKMIVEAHGGRIEVESEEGCGSTFRVLLPIK